MKKIMIPLSFLFATLSIHVFGQAGSIDQSFGNAGKVVTALGNGGVGWSSAVQNDWSVVVGGLIYNGVDSDFAIIRYLPNGGVDSTFGTNGIATTAMGSGNDIIYSIALQPDGKIVAAGLAWNGTDYDVAVARYNTNGLLDATFGNGGKVITAIGTGDDIGAAVKMDGWSIVVGGIVKSSTDNDFAVIRYTASGALDNTFGTNGIVITDMSPGNNDVIGGMAIQADSSIVVAGTSSPDATHNYFALARYKHDGTLDNSFGTNGKVITPGTGDDEALTIAIQPGGQIVVGGYANGGTKDNFGLTRYLSNGTLDNTFGTNGQVTTTVGNGDDALYALLLQPDGKIIGVGSSINAGVERFAMARYDDNGSLDNSFGNAGLVVTAMTAGDNEAYAASMQPDGKIVIAGYAHENSKDNFSLARYITGLNLGVIDLSVSNNSVLLYPNPVAQNATLQYTLTKEETVTISLVDMQGKTVKTFATAQKQQTGEHKIPVTLGDDLAAGSYLIVIAGNEGKMNVKVVK